MPQSSADSAPYLFIARAMEFIGDEPRVAEMLRMLLDSLESDIPKIWKLLDEDDVKGANRLLHPLKGFIPVFCTDKLVDHVAVVEILSKDCTAEQVKVAFTTVAPELERLKEEVRQYLAQNPA